MDIREKLTSRIFASFRSPWEEFLCRWRLKVSDFLPTVWGPRDRDRRQRLTAGKWNTFERHLKVTVPTSGSTMSLQTCNDNGRWKNIYPSTQNVFLYLIPDWMCISLPRPKRHWVTTTLFSSLSHRYFRNCWSAWRTSFNAYCQDRCQGFHASSVIRYVDKWFHVDWTKNDWTVKIEQFLIAQWLGLIVAWTNYDNHTP